jgi:hypothetical protein
MKSKLPEVLIRVIPHQEHRYSTIGDYYEVGDGKWVIEVSEVGDARYEFLVALHELVEWFLLWLRGVKEEEVRAFDEWWEEEAKKGNVQGDQPGNDVRAPYYWEHLFATLVERMVALQLGVDWKEYEERLKELYKGKNYEGGGL